MIRVNLLEGLADVRDTYYIDRNGVVNITTGKRVRVSVKEGRNTVWMYLKTLSDDKFNQYILKPFRQDMLFVKAFFDNSCGIGVIHKDGNQLNDCLDNLEVLYQTSLQGYHEKRRLKKDMNG